MIPANNKVGKISTLLSTSNQADMSTWSVMANLWYDIDIGSKWKPYFGGGVGYARNTFRPLATSMPRAASEGFAWQGGLGISYSLQHANI